MDAATLFLIMTLPAGGQRMTTWEYPTLQKCEAAAQGLREHPRQGATVEIYCQPHLRMAPAGEVDGNQMDALGMPGGVGH